LKTIFYFKNYFFIDEKNGFSEKHIKLKTEFMKKIIYLLLLSSMFFQCTTQKKSAIPSRKLDLAKADDNLEAFVKIRGSLKEGEEFTYYWSGTVYSFVAGERSVPLFILEGCSVGKMAKVEGGWQLITRETAIYRDLETGKILTKWYNPLLKDTVEVIPVWNDPVNQQFMLHGKYGDWGVDYTPLGEDRLCISSDIFLLYPSPLKKADFPENSRSDNYQAAELFQFFFSEKDMNNSENSIYADISWTRFSDFLPWMRMSDKPGQMVYQCRGYKVMNGKTLPPSFRDFIQANKPEFLHAPEKYTSPNMTSWKYFKALKEKK
jgi:hypothetical protein